MKRRSFLQTAAAVSAVGVMSSGPSTNAAPQAIATSNPSFALDDNKVTFFTNAVTRPVHVRIVADTHLFTDDDRGIPFRQFSGRMAKAYNTTTHFQTGQPTNPEQSFQETLTQANAGNFDLLALVGDIFSFPSEAAID